MIDYVSELEMGEEWSEGGGEDSIRTSTMSGVELAEIWWEICYLCIKAKQDVRERWKMLIELIVERRVT